MSSGPDPALLLFSYALFLGFVLLVPFAIAGLALINTGLGRSRSAAHSMTSVLCALAVAMLVYFVWGFKIQGFTPYMEHLGVPPESASAGLFLRGVNGPGALTSALLAMFAAGLASLVPLGGGTDRWRLGATCVSSVLFSGWVYPVFARLVWHPPQVFGVQFPHIVDAAGSGVIQATGGLTALSLAWLLGPRRGKYSSSGMPAAIPAHNVVFVLFGCLLSWIGWLGLNSAGAILYAGVIPWKAAQVLINTSFAAAGGGLAAAAITRLRFHRPDASLIANGWVGGLVASSAGCASLKPALAVLTGLVAGALVVFSVEWLEFHLKVDDPCGSVSVHAVAGIWGLLAAGIFAGEAGQFMAQLAGVATLLGLVLPMSYGLNWMLGLIVPHRVPREGERQGLDLHELGADAYPEFVVHADELIQR
ncbi:MAG TPA: hypothetical protein VFB00_05580 [Terriglobales bacterium]|nr:hypothetical protein [Terriglobales bacterium]